MEDRFWPRVDRRSDDECWLWQGARNGNGYGAISIKSKQTGTHRVAWELTNGPIPDGMLVCHRCDTPMCCNPSHLFLGTVADNTRDAARKGRLYDSSGSNNGAAKITEADVAEIRRAYASGEVTTVQLGAEYGIHPTTVVGIVRGTRWKQLADDGLVMPQPYPRPDEGICRNRLHAMTPENTQYVRRTDGSMKRICAACHRATCRRKGRSTKQ